MNINPKINELTFEELAKDYFCFVIEKFRNNQMFTLYGTSGFYHVSEFEIAEKDLEEAMVKIMESFTPYKDKEKLQIAVGHFSADKNDVFGTRYVNLFTKDEEGNFKEVLYTGFFQKVHHYFGTHFNSMRDARAIK